MSRILFILICFWSAQSTAQPAGHIQYFGADEGYPMSEVGNILKCKDGYLWMGAREGLFRYDGYDFSRIEFHPADLQIAKSDVVRALHYDTARHCLYIGTIDNGIFQYSLATNRARYIQLPDSLSRQMSTQSKRDFYQEEPDRLWISTLDGLLLFDLKNEEFSLFQRVSDRNEAFDDPWSNRMDELLVADSSDHYWLASHRGMYLFNPIHKTFQLIEGLMGANGYPYHITDIYQTENQGLLIGTWVNGLFNFDPESKEVTGYDLMESFGQGSDFVTIHQLNSGLDNEVLLATSAGVISFDLNDQQFQMIPGSSSTNHTQKLSAICTYIDQQSILWVGHMEGLTKMSLDPGLVHHIDHQAFEETSNNQLTLISPMNYGNGNILLGSANGLWNYDINQDKLVRSVELEKIVGKKIYEFVTESDSTNLIIAQNGLFRIKTQDQDVEQICNAEEMQKFHFGLLLSTTLDHSGNLWYGLQWGRGICRLNLDTKAFRYFPQSEFFADSLLSSGGFENIIADKNNHIWISTFRGLLQFDQQSEKFELHQSKAGAKTGIRDTKILGITIDKEDHIWINAAGKGLHRIDPDQTIYRELPYFPAEQFGLNLIGYLTTDSRDYLWATSTSGVLKIDPETRSYQSLNRSDGFPTDLLAPWRIESLNDSTMSLSTFDGINIWNPSLDRKQSQPPVVILTSAKIFDKDIETDTTPNHLQKIHLKHNQNFFSFTFTAVDFKDPKKNIYRYKLEGFDPNWIESGTRHYANYTNVPPGNYTFRVSGANADGVWSDQPKSIDVKVIAPYWQRAWFYLLCAILGAAIIYLINRYQVNQIRKEERIKTEFNKKLSEVEMEVLRSQMNPHFLFNALNSIKHFILANDKFVAAEYLTNFSRLVRQILNNSKSKTIRLEQELETLRLYIEMEKMRFENKFTYEIIVDENVDTFSRMIPPLILQPYVENAIWHGLMHKKDPGHLSIQIKEKDGSLKCVIEDDGIGRKKALEIKSKSATKGKSFGMQITKSRIDHAAEYTDVQIIDKGVNTNGATGTRVEISLQQNSIK